MASLLQLRTLTISDPDHVKMEPDHIAQLTQRYSPSLHRRRARVGPTCQLDLSPTLQTSTLFSHPLFHPVRLHQAPLPSHFLL